MPVPFNPGENLTIIDDEGETTNTSTGTNTGNGGNAGGGNGGIE